MFVTVPTGERNDMNMQKKKRKMVPMYSAEDFFSGKKDAKPVGWMSDPDAPGPVLLDKAAWERLVGGQGDKSAKG